MTTKLDAATQLKQLILRQAEAVAHVGASTPLFLSDDGFPRDVIAKRRKWSRQLEEQWAEVIGACMHFGYLDNGDALITTRLILGMITSAAQRCDATELISAEEIAHAVAALLHLEHGSSRWSP